MSALTTRYMRVWQYVGWRIGPVALGLFAYIGQIKANPAVAWFPIDLTATVGVIVLAAAVAAHVRHGSASRRILIPIALLAVLLLGLIGSSFHGYGLSKVTTLYTFTLLCMLAPFYLLRTSAQRRVFLITLAVIGVVISVVMFVHPVHAAEWSPKLLFEGTNTIGTARMAATALIICLIVAIVKATATRWRIVCGVASVLLVAANLATGSRAPLIAAIAAVALVLIVTPAFRRIRIWALIGTAAVAVGVLVWAAIAPSGNRILSLFAGDLDHSAVMREDFWGAALSHLVSAPFGTGWGGFGELPGSGTSNYAHNLLLGVTLEAGWIPGLGVAAFFVASLVVARRRALTPTTTIVAALLVFTICNSLVSGDINTNRLMWMVLSCAWVLPARLGDDADILQSGDDGVDDRGIRARRSARARSLHDGSLVED